MKSYADQAKVAETYILSFGKLLINNTDFVIHFEHTFTLFRTDDVITKNIPYFNVIVGQSISCQTFWQAIILCMVSHNQYSVKRISIRP